MIRHRKKERNHFPNFNTASWETEKNIDTIYSELLQEDNSIALPSELEEHSSGREAVFKSQDGTYQLNIHEYQQDWKSNEVDLLYFGKLDDNVDKMIKSYRDRI